MNQSPFKWMMLNEEQPILGLFRLETEHPYIAGRLPTSGLQVQLFSYIYFSTHTHTHYDWLILSCVCFCAFVFFILLALCFAWFDLFGSANITSLSMDVMFAHFFICVGLIYLKYCNERRVAAIFFNQFLCVLPFLFGCVFKGLYYSFLLACVRLICFVLLDLVVLSLSVLFCLQGVRTV